MARARNGEPRKSRGVVENIAESGKERIEQQKRAAAAQTDKLADVVAHAKRELDRGDFPVISGYANQLAARMKNFADGLRDRSLEELIKDTRRVARLNPQMFFLGSIAAGVALGALLQSLPERFAAKRTGR